MICSLVKQKTLKKKTLSPYFSHFQKTKKLDKERGDNELRYEVYKYTVNVGVRKSTKQFVNFFKVFETQKVFFRIPDKYNRFGQLKVSKILGNNLENLEEVKIISVPNEKYFSDNIQCDQSYVFDYAGKDNTNRLKTFRHVTAIRCNSPYIVSFKQEKPLSNDECKNQNKIPVLLVPGIMGSDTKWHGSVYPQIPKESPAWDNGELVIHDPLGSSGFTDLKDNFIEHGYKEKCNVLEVPYDWRLSIPKIRDLYLIPWIQEARRLTGQNRVDIIAHSMGGLVTRAYIQSNKYQNDIRNFVMIGTPNQGSANPYLIWEGGDSITLDKLVQSKGEPITEYRSNWEIKKSNWSGAWAKYFYTNTINENYQEITDKGDLCIWAESRVGLKYDTPIACNKEKIYDFVHKNAPSLGQLMPTYEKVLVDIKNNETKNIEVEKNEFLLALNNGSTFKNEIYDLPQNIKNKISGKLIYAYGNNWNTIKNIAIDTNQTNNSNYLYKDGIPSLNPYSKLPNVVYENGDGTVPQTSAKFIFDNLLGTSNVQHFQLTGSLINDIFNFINLNSP